MKKKVILLGIILILVTVSLSGCNDDEDKEEENYSVVGTWSERGTDGNQFIFKEDGTCFVIYESGTQSVEGTYTTTDTLIKMTFTGESGVGLTLDMTYTFLSENILSVKHSLTGEEQEGILDRELN